MFKAMIPGIMAFLLWYMQIIDPRVNLEGVEQHGAFGALWTSFKFYLFTYRGYVGALASLLVVIFSVKDSVYRPRRESQSIVHNQLKEIMDDCFPKKSSQVRLTVFKRADWSEAIVHYVFHRLVQGLRTDGPKSLKGFWTGLPATFCKHLIIFSRIGTPSQTVLTTTYQIPDDEEEAEGFVGLAWKSQVPVKTQLPDIRSIGRLRDVKVVDELDPKDQKSINEYMEKGNIKNFRKLQLIHRFSTFMWAATIYDAGNEPWGVLVLDSSEKDGLTKQNEKKLETYRDSIRKIIARVRDRAS